LGWRYASIRLRYLPAMSCEGVEDFLTKFAKATLIFQSTTVTKPGPQEKAKGVGAMIVGWEA
jgi:hypothetical protein